MTAFRYLQSPARPWAVAVVLAACFALGCTPENGSTEPGTGGSTSTGGVQPGSGGGTTTGGTSSTGGSSSAGGNSSTGGSTVSTGGAATGGKASGGIATGGVAVGGAATGGASTGGRASGGAATGGTATGGRATGGASAGGTGTGGTSGGGPSYPYVFSCFNDSAAVSSLQIYTSNDALNFTLLTDTGYTGPTGNLRDPSIMKHTDGKFYVAFTTPPAGTGCCGPESSFSIASSADLKNWTTVTSVPCGVAGTNNVWAPEWFKDPGGNLHVLVSVDQKTYRYEPTDASLTRFGGGTWIGIGPGYIDTFIVTIGTTYHAFTKKQATLYIEHATATSLDGPWTFVGTNDWAGWGTHREAPALVNLGNGTWRFYCDGGSAGHEMYSDSTDIFQTWTATKTLPVVGNSISHGTVIKGN
jgi:hypothetical protein